MCIWPLKQSVKLEQDNKILQVGCLQGKQAEAIGYLTYLAKWEVAGKFEVKKLYVHKKFNKQQNQKYPTNKNKCCTCKQLNLIIDQSKGE